MSHLNKTGLERVRQHMATMSSNKANKITLEDGTIMDLQDVYDTIPDITFITLDEIDAICGITIYTANEVRL